MAARKLLKEPAPSMTNALSAPVFKQGISKRIKSPKALSTLDTRLGDTNKHSIFGLVNQGLWDQTVSLREGLSAQYVCEMSDALDMPRASLLDNLQLPRSTIEARIKNKTPLTSAEGSAVLRTAKALAKAEEVFENREQIEISKYYERLPKPTSTATEEFLEEKIMYRYRTETDQHQEN